MPRIGFDAAHCVGHALCNGAAPDVYELDDSGYCQPPSQIDESSSASAHAGADACPEQAITVIDDAPDAGSPA